MKNFKKLLIFSLMLTLASQGYSQTFGIKGGLNFKNMIVGDWKTEMETGFNLGATVEFPINKMFVFGTGLSLSNKGAKVTYEGDPTTYKLTYLDVPLTCKVKFAMGGMNLYGLFGPYIGFGLGGQYYDGQTDTKIQWQTSSITEYYFLKRLDYGLNIGTGVEFGAIEVGLNYGFGLADIAGFDEDKIYNRVLSLSIGYTFGKK